MQCWAGAGAALTNTRCFLQLLHRLAGWAGLWRRQHPLSPCPPFLWEQPTKWDLVLTKQRAAAAADAQLQSAHQAAAASQKALEEAGLEVEAAQQAVQAASEAADAVKAAVGVDAKIAATEQAAAEMQTAQDRYAAAMQARNDAVTEINNAVIARRGAKETLQTAEVKAAAVAQVHELAAAALISAQQLASAAAQDAMQAVKGATAQMLPPQVCVVGRMCLLPCGAVAQIVCVCACRDPKAPRRKLTTDVHVFLLQPPGPPAADGAAPPAADGAAEPVAEAPAAAGAAEPAADPPAADGAAPPAAAGAADPAAELPAAAGAADGTSKVCVGTRCGTAVDRELPSLPPACLSACLSACFWNHLACASSSALWIAEYDEADAGGHFRGLVQPGAALRTGQGESSCLAAARAGWGWAVQSAIRAPGVSAASSVHNVLLWHHLHVVQALTQEFVIVD